MKYELAQNGKELKVIVEGRLDTLSSPELEKALDPVLKGVEKLVFDFSRLDYISSAGLRVVMHAHKNKNMGGETRVIHCNPVVKAVFEVTGLTNLMEVEE